MEGEDKWQRSNLQDVSLAAANAAVNFNKKAEKTLFFFLVQLSCQKTASDLALRHTHTHIHTRRRHNSAKLTSVYLEQPEMAALKSPNGGVKEAITENTTNFPTISDIALAAAAVCCKKTMVNFCLRCQSFYPWSLFDSAA